MVENNKWFDYLAKLELNKLFAEIDALLFYLDGCVVSENIKAFKKKYYKIKKELSNEKRKI